jgi:hypothetical protein
MITTSPNMSIEVSFLFISLIISFISLVPSTNQPKLHGWCDHSTRRNPWGTDTKCQPFRNDEGHARKYTGILAIHADLVANAKSEHHEDEEV